MANITQPQVVINYISQKKKIIVGRNNQPSQQLIKFDYNLTDTYNFQIVNAINQIVQFDGESTYQIFGSYIDSKQQLHILFYTNSYQINNNVLTFIVDTYTSQYLDYVKTQKQIDLSIVASKGSKTSIVLRDKAIAYPRPTIEGQTPTEIVYKNIMAFNYPVSGQFGAGSDLNLVGDAQSFAFGDTLTTNNANQFVIGYNNEPDATKAFIVANSGNIFTVDYEGNVEAGDLNVGAISATSITVSGEDLNQVIDDKVEYLSTAFDDKLSATEDWVSDTFETKESATQTFNEFEGDIGQISAFVSGLPADIAVKANETEVQYISSFVSGLPQNINDISNAMNQKADKEKLNELSGTVETIQTSGLITSGQVDTKLADYLPRSEYVNTTYSADDNTLKLVGTQFSIKSLESVLAAGDDGITLDTVDGVTYIYNTGSGSGGGGESDKTYTAGTGLTGVSVTSSITRFDIKTDWLTQFIEDATSGVQNLSTGTGLQIVDNVISISASYLSANALEGYATQNFVTSQGYLVEADLADYALKTDLNDYQLSANSLTAYNDLTGKIDYVSGQVDANAGNITELSTKVGNIEADYVVNADITGFITENALTGLATTETVSAIDDRLTAVENAGYITDAALVGYATEQYVVDNTSAFITSADIPTSYVQQDQLADYATIESLTAYTEKTDFDTVTGALDTKIDQVSGAVPTSYVQPSEIEDMATKTWVGEQDFATTSQIPTDVATSAYVTGLIQDVVTGQIDPLTGRVQTLEQAGYITSSDIPTSYVQQDQLTAYTDKDDFDEVSGVVATISGDYVKSADIADFVTENTLEGVSGDIVALIPSDYTTSAQVSAIVEGYNYITIEDVPPGSVYGVGFGLAASGEANNIFYLTGTVLSGSDSITVENNVISLTNSSNYIKSGDNVSLLNNDAGYITDAALVGYATTETVTGIDNRLTAIEDDYTTSGQVSSIVEGMSSTIINGLATTDELQSVSGELNSAIGSKADSTAIEDMATQTWVGQQGFALTSQLPTDYTTSAQVSSIVESYDYVTNTTLGDYALKSQLPTDYTTSANVSSIVEDMSATIINGLAKTSQIPTTVAELTDSSNYALTSQLPTDYTTSAQVSGIVEGMSSTIIDGLATQSFVTTQGYLTDADLADYAQLSDLPSDYTTSGNVSAIVEGMSATIIDGLAKSSDIPTDYTTSGQVSSIVESYGYITGITNNALLSDIPTDDEITGLAKSYVDTLNIATTYATKDELSAKTTSAQVSSIVESYNYITAEGIPNTYALKTDIPTDYTTSAQVSSIVTSYGYAKASDIPTTVAELTDSGDYALKSELIDTEDVSGVVEAMSTTIIDGLATEGFVTSQGYITNAALVDYAQLSDLPSDYTTSGQASAIVTGYVDSVSGDIRSGLATTSDISDMATQTWVGQQGFASASDIPTVGDLSAGMYSAISGDVEDQITGKGYITNVALTNYALKSELPVVSTYVQGTGISITSSDTNQYTVAFDNSQLGYITGYNEGTGIKIDNGEISLTAAIPSNSDITDIVSTVIHNYVVASGLVTGTGLFYDETDNSLNVVLSAANDSNMIVSADNNGVVWLSSVAQGGGGGGTTYTAGNGIDLTNNIISVKLSAGPNINLSTDQNGYVIISGTPEGSGGGGGVDIPTDTSDLTNGAGFITQSAITNKQRVYEYSSENLIVPDGNEITYNRAYEIFKTTYLTETGYTPLLQFHEVNVPNGSLASNEVATFEEWMYLSGVDVPSSEFAFYPDLELIGEFPATLEAGKTHVFVRRIIYGSSKQYVSYAYSF